MARDSDPSGVRKYEWFDMRLAGFAAADEPQDERAYRVTVPMSVAKPEERSDLHLRIRCAALLLLGLPGAIACAVGALELLSGEGRPVTLAIALYGGLVALACWRQARAGMDHCSGSVAHRGACIQSFQDRCAQRARSGPGVICEDVPSIKTVPPEQR